MFNNIFVFEKRYPVSHKKKCKILYYPSPRYKHTVKNIKNYIIHLAVIIKMKKKIILCVLCMHKLHKKKQF